MREKDGTEVESRWLAETKQNGMRNYLCRRHWGDGYLATGIRMLTMWIGKMWWMRVQMLVVWGETATIIM